jgi:TPR repeat protein
MKEFKIVVLLLVVAIAGCSEQKRDFASEVGALDFTLLLEGHADQGDYSDELAKLTDLANSGNPIAQERYADVLIRSGEQQKAIGYLDAAIELDYLLANETLAVLYFDEGTAEGYLKSYKHFVAAAEADISSSQTFLGLCFNDPDCEFPNNEYLASYWLSRAIDNKNSSAMFFEDDLKRMSYSKKQTAKEQAQVLCVLDGSC